MDNLFNRVARRRRRGQGGFTLIELLVVIAVLAILAAIVIFNIVGVANRGKSSACGTDTQTVQTAVDAYQNDKSVYPVSGGDKAAVAVGDGVNLTELSPAYMHTQPDATTTGAFSYKDTSGGVKAANC